MFPKVYKVFIVSLLLFFLALSATAQNRCFTKETRTLAEQKAKVWQTPDRGYDPRSRL